MGAQDSERDGRPEELTGEEKRAEKEEERLTPRGAPCSVAGFTLPPLMRALKCTSHRCPPVCRGDSFIATVFRLRTSRAQAEVVFVSHLFSWVHVRNHHYSNDIS